MESETPFSTMDLPTFEGDIYKFVSSKKLETVYSEREYSKDGNKINLFISRTPQNFYICGEKIMDSEDWNCTIYYLESSYKELLFFLNNFLKNYKNGTTNNTTT